MTDLPVWARVTIALAGELARPFAIMVTSASVSAATVINAVKGDDLSGAAIFIAAAFAGVAALYGAKSWEIASAGKHQAQVDMARSSQPQSGEKP